MAIPRDRASEVSYDFASVQGRWIGCKGEKQHDGGRRWEFHHPERTIVSYGGRMVGGSVTILRPSRWIVKVSSLLQRPAPSATFRIHRVLENSKAQTRFWYWYDGRKRLSRHAARWVQMWDLYR